MQTWQHRTCLFLTVIQKYVDGRVKKNAHLIKLPHYTMYKIYLESIQFFLSRPSLQQLQVILRTFLHQGSQTMHVNHFEILWKCILFPGAWGGSWDSAFLTSSQVMLTLLIYVPHWIATDTASFTLIPYLLRQTDWHLLEESFFFFFKRSLTQVSFILNIYITVTLTRSSHTHLNSSIR